MKKLLIILSVILISCESKNVTTSSTSTMIKGIPIYIYIIDSCEYIGYFEGSGNDFFTHKGNCKNPIHYK